MTRPERVLLITLGTIYAAGILLALVTTGHLATYLPHAAVLLVCAAALRAMLRDQRSRHPSPAMLSPRRGKVQHGASHGQERHATP